MVSVPKHTWDGKRKRRPRRAASLHDYLWRGARQAQGNGLYGCGATRGQHSKRSPWLTDAGERRAVNQMLGTGPSWLPSDPHHVPIVRHLPTSARTSQPSRSQPASPVLGRTLLVSLRRCHRSLPSLAHLRQARYSRQLLSFSLLPFFGAWTRCLAKHSDQEACKTDLSRTRAGISYGIYSQVLTLPIKGRI